MKKTKTIFLQAEKMFITEQKTAAEIADELNISTVTVWRWAKKNDWADRQAKWIEEHKALNEELYELARIMTRRQKEMLMSGGQIDANELYALKSFLQYIDKVKGYEDKKTEKKKSSKSAGEVLTDIENMLGLTK